MIDVLLLLTIVSCIVLVYAYYDIVNRTAIPSKLYYTTVPVLLFVILYVCTKSVLLLTFVVPFILLYLLVEDTLRTKVWRRIPVLDRLSTQLSYYVADTDMLVYTTLLSLYVYILLNDPFGVLNAFLYSVFSGMLYLVLLSHSYKKLKPVESFVLFLFVLVSVCCAARTKPDGFASLLFIVVFGLYLLYYDRKHKSRDVVSVDALPEEGWVEVDGKFYALHIPESKQELDRVIREKGLKEVVVVSGKPMHPVLAIMISSFLVYLL